MDKKINEVYDVIAPYFTPERLEGVIRRIGKGLDFDDYRSDLWMEVMEEYEVDHGRLNEVITVKQFYLLKAELTTRIVAPLIKQRFNWN